MAVELCVLVHLYFVDFTVDFFFLAANFILEVFTDFLDASVNLLDAFSEGANVAGLVLKEVFLPLGTFLYGLDLVGVGCQALGGLGVESSLLLLVLAACVVNG